MFWANPFGGWLFLFLYLTFWLLRPNSFTCYYNKVYYSQNQ